MIADSPIQNTIGQSMLAAGWSQHALPPPGIGASLPADQGAGEAAAADAMAVPCIGSPTTNAATTKAAQIL